MMKARNQNPAVRVIPVRQVVHTRHSDLVAIRGHRGYYVNLLSGRITYRKGRTKIPTGETEIMKAKRFVETMLKAHAEGITEEQASRALAGELNPTLETLWNDLIAEKRNEAEGSTIENYMTNWRNAIAPFWSKRHVHEVTDQTIVSYKKWYLEQHPTRYFGHTLCHLKVLLKYAVAQKFIKAMPDTKPLENVDEITSKRKRREWGKVSKAFTEAEVQALLAAAERIKRPDMRSRAVLGILLGVRCGLRKMEAMSLRWSSNGVDSWVDLDGRIIHVWSKKNFKWREVPIPKAVLQAFVRHQNEYIASEWVFPMPSNPERFITSQVFDKVWAQARELASVDGRFHDLRHTFATRTAEEGWPPVIACEILDQSLKIYQRTYCKPSTDSKRSWMLRDEDD
jgi:integrase